MRVFRFRDPTEPAHTKQEQDIVCEIYLEESESTYEEKQCECYTPDECVSFTQPETTQIKISSTQSQTETSSITTTQTTTSTATTLPTTTTPSTPALMTTTLPPTTQEQTLDIKIWAGMVIYGIMINGIRTGNNHGGGILDIPIQQGENVLALEYGIKRDQEGEPWANGICGLSIITDVKMHGPYGDIGPNYPCPTEYFLEIPFGMGLSDFLENEKIMDITGDWILGFNSQVPIMLTTIPPSTEPTYETIIGMTDDPNFQPTFEPTVEPTLGPTGEPTVEPTGEPTLGPTGEPTVEPTGEPTLGPTVEPTGEPTLEPTSEPTGEPTLEPTGEPTLEPTGEPTLEPTLEPTSPPGKILNIFFFHLYRKSNKK